MYGATDLLFAKEQIFEGEINSSEQICIILIGKDNHRDLLVWEGFQVFCKPILAGPCNIR